LGPIESPVHAPVQDGRSKLADPNDTSFLSNNPPPLDTSMQVSSPLPPGTGGWGDLGEGAGHLGGAERLQCRLWMQIERAVVLDRPKRKSSKRPRFHSETNDGPEKEGMAMDDVEMQPPTSRERQLIGQACEGRSGGRESRYQWRSRISFDGHQHPMHGLLLFGLGL